MDQMLSTFAAAGRLCGTNKIDMAATEGIQPLPVVFDLSCPITLPERPPLIQWPWPIA